MPNKIERLVKEIVAEVCNTNSSKSYCRVSAKKISNKHNFKLDLPIDTISLYDIFASVEDRFYLNIKEAVAKKITTVDDLIECVECQY
ncbi:hypothetical protein KAI65_02070 [Candidatus Parcubacteria bacterium]|nr:hypothetical protein [Candidatus Parcubacteria bacterium]